MEGEYLSMKTKKRVFYGCFLWTICITQFIQLLMLGIFAYRNPDPKESYYVYSSNEHMYGSLEEAQQVSQFDPVDMHGRFHTWLKWGFWNLVSALCFVLFSIATRPSGHGFTLKLYLGSVCCCACGLVASI